MKSDMSLPQGFKLPQDWIVGLIKTAPQSLQQCPHGPYAYVKILRSSHDLYKAGQDFTLSFRDPNHPANELAPERVAWIHEDAPNPGRIVFAGGLDQSTRILSASFAMKYPLALVHAKSHRQLLDDQQQPVFMLSQDEISELDKLAREHRERKLNGSRGGPQY